MRVEGERMHTTQEASSVAKRNIKVNIILLNQFQTQISDSHFSFLGLKVVECRIPS